MSEKDPQGPVNVENLRIGGRTFLSIAVLLLVGVVINTVAEPRSSSGEIGFIVVSDIALLAMAGANLWPYRTRRLISAELARRAMGPRSDT